MIDRFFNSLFDASARRFSAAIRDVGLFVTEVHTVTGHVKAWRGKVQRMDEGKLAEMQETVMAAIGDLRIELRGLAEEMDIAEGKLKEAESGAGLAIDRLATGEHLLHRENRALILAGDAAGLTEYLLNIDPVMYRRAIKDVARLDRDRLVSQLQMIKGELGLTK